MTDVADSRFVVHHGDNMAILPTLADCSVDAIVTDPPAGIAFMGKAWDSDKGGRDAWIAWLSEVMGQCLRVLKPGGHALVWAIPRTSHWTGMAIENAGFEVRDRIAHCFGSGFPKSLNVAKAIASVTPVTPLSCELSEDEAGFCAWIRDQSGLTLQTCRAALGSARFFTGEIEIVNTATVDAPRMGRRSMVPTAAAWARALPAFKEQPPAWVEALVKNPPQPSPSTPGEAWTKGACRGTEGDGPWQGWGTALKPAIEDWWLARKPLVGNVAQNVIAHGTGALNIDGCRVGQEQIETTMAGRNGGTWEGNCGLTQSGSSVHIGRWPANLIHSGEPEVLAAFPQTTSGKPCGVRKAAHHFGNAETGTDVTGYGDTGSAARFFMQCPPDEATRLVYTPKASRADRDKGNTHSTVKPIALMRYLCRLITPPDGVVLDPFAGSGSSGQAAMFEGFRFIGIEQDTEHVELARHRVGLAARNGWQPGLELESAA